MRAIALRKFVTFLPIFLLLTCSSVAQEPAPKEGVQWGSLLRESGYFLGIQHGFRLATEPGTRQGMKGPFFNGWYDSVASLHGWSDGDPFLVNYIGHPMQGAVTGYIWVQNDTQFRKAEFGANRKYWKSRLRATAFNWAYSTQFELGPLSEASLGKIQNSHPQQGLVDHVITPVAGFAWMVGEDALDRFVIAKLEQRIHNRTARILLRGGLNPSRSMANAMRGKMPWYRDTRPGILRPDRGPWPEAAEANYTSGHDEIERPERVRAPFQLSTATRYTKLTRATSGGDPLHCIGGFATPEFAVTQRLSIVGEAGGCKVFNVEEPISADVLTFMVGPRVYLRKPNRVNPYVEFLAGVQRVTADLNQIIPGEPNPPPLRTWQTDTFTMSTGGGVEVVLGRAVSFRVADVRYSYSMVSATDALPFRRGMQISTGITLRMGTW